MSAGLYKLLQCNPAVWQGCDSGNSTAGIETGFDALDSTLPGGGWPAGALTEILSEQQGIGELRLVVPTLARLSLNGRWQAWITPPYTPYPPALLATGIDLGSTTFVRPNQDADTLWASERILRSGACSAVLAWPKMNDFRALRRLQLAAEQGQCWGVLFRTAHFAAQPSPAALRLRLHSCGDDLEVQILKARGGCHDRTVRLTI